MKKGKRPTGFFCRFIGSGKEAGYSIAWLTIFLSFTIGGALSFVVQTEQIKMVWSIFAPIITLALGHTFRR